MNITALLTILVIGFLGFQTSSFLDKVVERVPTLVLAPFLCTQPIFSVFLSSFPFRSSPGFVSLAGSCCLNFFALESAQSDGSFNHYSLDEVQEIAESLA